MKTKNEMSQYSPINTPRKDFLHNSRTNELISTNAEKGDTVEEIFSLGTISEIFGQFQK